MYSTDTSRRTVLKATGASLAAIGVAGCLGGDDDDNGGGDGGDGGNGGDDGVSIDPGTEIVLDGQSSGWVGKSPSEINGETNPTLILQEGESYTIGWDEGDGATHNIEIRDSGGSVVGDYSTDFTGDPGEDQFIDFEATSEMASYVCDPHPNQMNGDIIVE
ncbi:twin-arginine translocation signal domain-containing protein [Halovivax gelatinilyticus]|uniref:twin-arginine translocation signal domain-containing protein n=1 Tax=Halovivax gelatinilyticus TaxID=2961597 RepID=UPI0020CA625D|nr:twin-arginine translocation signal domain-containing protein [Halovivax gelatinilyticus]